jgi:hypothetical protein
MKSMQSMQSRLIILRTTNKRGLSKNVIFLLQKQTIE